ncbi:UNVERIFIED_CONTAM: hypothetical protein RMT77_011304 [Armadillidium vulgare]
MALANRLAKELKLLKESPPPSITVWEENDNMKKLYATIFADDGSVYQGGSFKLEIEIPERYPFNPPNIRFLTPIYHPNIDNMGRICLDLLKMPPSGGWRPALSISNILTSIRVLMNAPNPDDPLVPEIAEEFKMNPTLFEANAKIWTQKYALDKNVVKGRKRSLSETD